MSERLWIQPKMTAIVLLLLGTVVSAGCHRRFFPAATLPPQFAARPTFDASGVDISLLAAPSYSSEQIFPGDTLKMTVVTGADTGKPEEWPVRVMEDGSVQLPIVGRLVVSGRDLQSAQDLIRLTSIERGVYTNPSVSLAIEQRRTNRVSVVGAVDEPGDYELAYGQSDLLSALLAAGGLTEDADRYIEVRRANRVQAPATETGSYLAQAGYAADRPSSLSTGNSSTETRVTRIDLVAAAQRAQPTPIPLNDGDVVTVRKRPPRYVHVIGLVNRPDRFELKANESARLLDAIAMAGGAKLSIADRVIVVRQVEGNAQPITIEASMREAKQDAQSNLLLADGDVVSVEETPVTFAVSTLQNVVRFGVNGFF